MKTAIFTERLIIRPLFENDLDGILSITGQPETYTYIPEKPMDELAARNMIECCQVIPDISSLPSDLVVVLVGTKELVGLLSFTTISKRFRTVEIGWMFHTSHRCKGYASEAACALMEYGFSTLGLHRIIATCDPRNIPSVRIMEKLGMRREAEFMDSVILGDGEWHNEYFYAITEKEWVNKKYQEEI